MNKHRPLVIHLDGCIGCGKSTQINCIKDGYDVRGYREPNLRDMEGWNALDWYYKDMDSHALGFQMAVIDSRYMQLPEICAHPERFALYERGLFGDAIMAEANLRHKPNEWNIYKRHFRNVMDMWRQHVDVGPVIYLKSSAPVCMKRIQTRGVSEECSIPLHYIERVCATLTDTYENRSIHALAELFDFSVYTIDVDAISPEKIHETVMNCINEIRSSIAAQ